MEVQNEVPEAVERALDDDPNLRYRTAEEVARLLFERGYLHEEPSIPFVADALATVEAEEEALGPT